MTDCTHLWQQKRKMLSCWSKTLSSHKNNVQSINDDDRRSVKFDYKGLIFIDLGIKINEIYYCDVLLSQQLLSVIFQLSDKFIFQQNSSSVSYTHLTLPTNREV